MNTNRYLSLAAHMFSFGASQEDVAKKLVEQGASPEDAFLCTMGGRILNKPSVAETAPVDVPKGVAA